MVQILTEKRFWAAFLAKLIQSVWMMVIFFEDSCGGLLGFGEDECDSNKGECESKRDGFHL